MQPTTDQSDATEISKTAAKPRSETVDFILFLIKLVLFVAIFRSFIFSPFNIPSESMLPRLVVGDYLLASKWSYGYSRHSLPFSVPLIPDRIFASEPERGDVVVFKAPPGNDVDYIKRLIGLPGDTVQMIDGELHLNGRAIPKTPIADFVIARTPNTSCFGSDEDEDTGEYIPGVYDDSESDGTAICRYPRFRETLPNDKSYNVLDLGFTPADDSGPFVVPEGHMFMMGDNRDNSQDSRFPATPGGGIGLVPQANLVGKASVVVFSTDGSASWLLPWTWFSAARWDRIGEGF